MKLLILILLVLGVASSRASATTWIAPQRPLTADEWLEEDLSGADAVAVGQVLSVGDTIVDRAADGSGISTRSISIHASRWLKGDPGLSALVVGVSSLDPEPLRGEHLTAVARSERIFVFMLKKLPDGWLLCDGPDPAGAGMQPLQSQTSPKFEQKLRSIIARQSIDAVLAHADLVVIGRLAGQTPCIAGSPLICSRVIAERTVGGTVAAETLSVFAPLLGAIPDDQVLFALRRSDLDEYEIVGSQFGCQKLVGDRPARWNVSLDELHTRFTRLHGSSGADKPDRH